MKKVLFATTALIAFTGVAAADITISGSARLGGQYVSGSDATGTAAQITTAAAAVVTAAGTVTTTKATVATNTAAGTLTAADIAAVTTAEGVLAAEKAALDAIDGTDSSTALESRVTVNIDFSTETDGGLELGGRIRLRADEAKATATNGAQIYVKSGGFKLTVGNICGAIECMPGLYGPTVGLNGNGYTGLVTNTAGAGYWSWDAYSSNSIGSNGAEVEYAVGDFKAHLSYGGLDSGAAYNRVALVVAYTFGDWTAALGLQDGDQAGGADDKTVITVTGKLGDFGVGFAAADNNGVEKYTINGSYTMGATTISAFVSDENSVAATDTPWGLGVSYDLGGAKLVGGYSQSEKGQKRASAGIKFSF